jgi:hypothetical protein
MAVYSGDSNFLGGSSASLNQVVNLAPTTTRLTSAPNPSRLGQTVTLTATVSSSSGGSPGGMVRFLDGTTVRGTPSLSGGIAALAVSTFTAGAHRITASYAGNSNFTGSTSPVVAQQVNGGLVTPTVTLTVQPNTVNFGNPVTFTATVSYPGGPVPTGSITISEAGNGAKNYGVAILNNGTGVVKNSTIPVGSYNLVATYGGDGGSHYNGAQSSSVPLRVRLAITNNRTANVYGINPNGVALRALGGVEEAKLVSSTPVEAGMLAPGASTRLSMARGCSMWNGFPYRTSRSAPGASVPNRAHLVRVDCAWSK